MQSGGEELVGYKNAVGVSRKASGGHRDCVLTGTAQCNILR